MVWTIGRKEAMHVWHDSPEKFITLIPDSIFLN